MKRAEPRKSEAERLVIGLSGASGVAYGIRLLDACRELGIESHLVMTKPAEMTIGYETKLSPKQVAAKADYNYAVQDIAAPIASGSFRNRGMIVAPCSVRTMSEIATGVTTNCLTRAADVMLKERRPLVLMVRETPLHLGHLRTMTALADVLGLSAIHVNRVLRQLRERGLVTFRDGRVSFEDHAGLVELAEFDAAYLDQTGPLLK